MIEKKLIKPKELSGGLCVKIVIKEIKVDSEEVENFISDLYKLDEEKNEVMYYENVAYTLAKLPVTLTEEESFQGLYGSATCEYADMIIPEIVKPTSANTIAEIEAYLDGVPTSYVGVTKKEDLLALC